MAVLSGTASNVLSGIVGAIVVYVSFDFSLFSWHPILMAIAVILNTISINSIRARKAIKGKIEREMRSKQHFFLNTLSLLCMGGALYVIYLNKELNGKPHFTTYHSWAGGATISLTLIGAAGGIWKTFFSGNQTLWLWQDFPHRMSGILSYSMAGVTFGFVVLGGWGGYKLGDASFQQYLVIALLVLQHFLMLLGGAQLPA